MSFPARDLLANLGSLRLPVALVVRKDDLAGRPNFPLFSSCFRVLDIDRDPRISFLYRVVPIPNLTGGIVTLREKANSYQYSANLPKLSWVFIPLFGIINGGIL